MPHTDQIRKFPVVVQDSMQNVQLSLAAATTDLRYIEASHGEMLDVRQRKLVHAWYKQLDEISAQIGDILGR